MCRSLTSSGATEAIDWNWIPMDSRVTKMTPSVTQRLVTGGA